jgi:pyruvate,water dikinase
MTIPVIPLSLRQRLATAYGLIKLVLRQMMGVRQLPGFLEQNLGFFESIGQRINVASSRSALYDLWRDVIDPHIRFSAWIVLGSATYSSDYTAKLRRDLIALAGVEDADLLLTGAVDAAETSSRPDVLASLGPLVNIERVARGTMEKGEYLSKFGHRGPHEFELTIPRPAEDPHWLERQLALLSTSPVDADALLEKRRKAFDAAWERFQAQHPRKATSIRRRMDESRRRAALREAARSEYVRDRWLVRRFAIRAGELTGLGDDVFYLTLDELLSVLSGGRIESDLIPARKKTVRAYRDLGPIPSIIRGRFNPHGWSADPRRRTDVYDAHAQTERDASNLISGAPGSAGRVQGRVRCLKNPDDGERLLAGEILVAAQTDIAWTPLFPRAAAIITDVGAPLSHAAIIARELGIAAVVGCGDATMRLRTGDVVRVDGVRGTVEVLNGEPTESSTESTNSSLAEH